MPAARPLVAHVVPAPDFVRHILIHDLRRHAERVNSFVICSDGPVLAPVRAEGIRIVPLTIARRPAIWSDLRALIALVRLLRSERVDIVHGYTPKGGLLATTAGWLAGVPVRLYGCRGLVQGTALNVVMRGVVRLCDHLTGRLATRILFVSGVDLRTALADGWCSARKAVYLGSGIDSALFPPGPRGGPRTDLRVRVRRQLGLPDDAPIALAVGRFVAEKGWNELATAAAQLRARIPSLRHVWVAPGMTGEAGMLPEDLPQRRGISDVVVKLGLRDDLPALYGAADVLVHPSHREGVPRVLMEAAATGLPIVASDIPGNREVVSHERSALLVPLGDAAAIAAAIERSLSDTAGAEVRAAVAQRDVAHRFDQNALTQRVIEIYDSLLMAATR